MASINEGDVIEGIFTIALALFIANGTIDKTKLNELRTKIDPNVFSTGRVRHTVAKNIKRSKKNRPPDFFTVNIEMRLKTSSVSEAYGKKYEVLYKKSKDIGKIDQKIDQLIEQASKSQFTKKIEDAINTFLDNNFGEVVTFTVIADGIAGESSGGDVKGDVTLVVYGAKKGSKQKVTEITIPFSLKSGSVTVANLSPYKGMVEIAKALKIKWDGEKKYARLSKPFNGTEEQKQKFKMIVSMYNDLKGRIVKQSKSSSSFTKDALQFLEKSIFGSDSADVVDVTDKGIKEITKQYFDILKKKVKLKVEAKGNNLMFVDSSTGSVIFQIRTKLRPPPANEAKFYLEVGKGIYAK
jgi:hypothetical protein